MRGKTHSILIVAATLALFTVGSVPAADKNIGRVLLTAQSVQRLMLQNEAPAKERLNAHALRLRLKLLANNLPSYKPYTQYLDSSANTQRARRVLLGLTQMRSSFEGLQYQIRCMRGIQPAQRYGWIEDHRSINFCRVFEDKVADTMGWHFHEMSHFRPPYGPGTLDHVYAKQDCIELAKTDPDKAINTAACWTFYLRAVPS